ncbi:MULTISPECIES: metalloregulator ArsR/SmtB family transcription factor [Vibrio]|jgi:ArsR family transcriptional regulator|uniref:ArsR family transcriptional regulator n=1 Tax=Vibrio mediterranei TaxID=689 RepID=A0ABX5DDI7_9VIBR|nr:MULTISPECIES: metalloregulator ArsR/SmtB family transcription factor [Vibrio]MCF4174078.1 metalloregulator ArsR/SmtB family transcription factor [Vibrio sp. McD22-P3]MCG9661070.1 metalloregulator ArsR/SmtB family transcription factor [Vibrio mediterranei]MCY9852938.1 metalloregulator ArsR/SmtB family transcription factor [Vibrio mediterranei]PCD87853.1 ArsR family transcriptional regulator [Vibrio mediterranei]PRQ67118.1 ArsR family transcriptional regulator [Vibrio mediterranei]
MTKKILFVCRGNSARSQLAEAIINRDYAEFYQAFSAGSSPSQVDARTISTLNDADFPTDELYSKSIDEFKDTHFDYVITLCSSAQRECGVFENTEESIYWDLPAPTSLSDISFEASLYDLQKRIDLFVTVHQPTNDLDFDPLVLHKCLGDQTRLMITLLIFTEVELSVGELCEALQESQPKISRALAVLRNCGIVSDRRKGQWAFYSISGKLPLWAIDILDASVVSMRGALVAANQLLNQSTTRPEKHN